MIILSQHPAFAEEKAEKKSSKEPTVITSHTLTTDTKAKTALFEGNVLVRKADMTLVANKMLVYYADEKEGNTIRKIEAEGNVKLTRRDRVITSQFALYVAEPVEQVIFTGEPRATDGENMVTGTKMTYLMKDERALVENSKVFLSDKER
jgi:lipopolysaccharide export system protein LptA